MEDCKIQEDHNFYIFQLDSSNNFCEHKSSLQLKAFSKLSIRDKHSAYSPTSADRD